MLRKNEIGSELKKIGKKEWFILIFFIFAILIFIISARFIGDDSSSSSGRNWSDLSEKEKENARWAYEVQQEINKRK